MNNRLWFVTNEEMNRIKAKQLSGKNVFLAEIDGDLIKTEEDYVESMRSAFCVPYDIEANKLGWYRDFMSDLLWIEQPNIVLLIKNYDRLLTEDTETKLRVMKYFTEILLPWWDGEVVGHMVGGVPRKFNIYVSE